MTWSTDLPVLPPRPADAHKASVGRVLVVGGSLSMSGAPALAALGALRGGAGLVRVAVPASIHAIVASFQRETMVEPLAEVAPGVLGDDAAGAIEALAAASDVVVLGMGLGRAEATTRLVHDLVDRLELPLVLDADGLAALGDGPERVAARRAPTVLTPHEGEAARLLGTTSAAVRSDREGAATSLAARSSAVVVLKGPHTLVTDGARRWQATAGHPVLATAGTGDVLAGVLGAFLAGALGRGGGPLDAARAAVHAHARAGEMLAAQGCDRGWLACEVARNVTAATREMRAT